MLATIGYEKCTPDDFVATLQENGIDVLVDIRERAQSRRPGFSKTQLSKNLESAGIEYVHLRELGDPKPGRDAARAGMIEEFKRIYSKVLDSKNARDALAKINVLARSKRICLMCYERDYRTCHRKIVADHLESSLGGSSHHLLVVARESQKPQKRRVLHSDQSATA